MSRPVALLVQADGIPDVLKVERRWVLWRYELRDSRWGKIPCMPTGHHAKANDPSTWTTFDAALDAYRTGRFDGIGFVLGDGWAGIDLDGITNGPIIDDLPCYRETSPSGTGVKAIGRAARIGGEVKFKADGALVFTSWTGARYFAITGHGCGDAATEITALLNELFPQRATFSAPDEAVPSYIPVGDVRGTERIEVRTDEQVLTLAASALNRDKFLRLYRGDKTGHGNDHSRADQALCGVLIYWCQGDLDQVDRLFRQSGLMRDHWNTRSYRRATLQKAKDSWLRRAVQP